VVFRLRDGMGSAGLLMVVVFGNFLWSGLFMGWLSLGASSEGGVFFGYRTIVKIGHFASNRPKKIYWALQLFFFFFRSIKPIS
jgi:hypothetical protein